MRSLMILALVVSWTLPVSANPFFIGRFDGAHAGPANTSAFSVYWNPAGLAEPSTRLQLHLLGVHRHAVYDRTIDTSELSDAEIAANSGANTTGALALVPSLAIAHGLNRGAFDFGVGAAAFIDRAGRTSWKKHLDAPVEIPGAVDGPQRWATINTNMLILSTGAGFGVGYRPWGLSMGVTPLYHFATLSTLRARNPDGRDRGFDDAGRLAEGRVLFDDGEGSRHSWILGARWTPSSQFSVSASWHSAIDLELEGLATITFGLADETTARAAFDLPVPQTIRTEMVIALTPTFTIRPLFSWSEWSIMETQQAINTDNGEVVLAQARDFSDIYAFKTVLDWQVDPSVVMHLGAQFETGATPVRTFEPGLAESDNVEGILGIGIQLTKTLTFSTSYTWQQYADVTVTESVQEPPTNGTYTDRRQYLTMDLEVLL